MSESVERVSATVWIESSGITRASWDAGSVMTGADVRPVSRWLAEHMWPESGSRESWEYIGYTPLDGGPDEQVREYRFERVNAS